MFFFDADDLMLPDKLRRQVEVFERHPEVGFTFTDFQVIDETDRVLVPSFLSGYRAYRALRKRASGGDAALDRDLLYRGLLRGNFIGTSSVAVRAEVLRQVGGFDESLASSEDVDLWLRLVRSCPAACVDSVGHGYRRHSASLMHEVNARHPLARITVLERQLALAPDPAARRVILRRIGENHCNLGFIHEISGERELAWRHYALSLRLRPRLLTFWGWLKCLPTHLRLHDAGASRGGAR